jgi:hypothetical protein
MATVYIDYMLPSEATRRVGIALELLICLSNQPMVIDVHVTEYLMLLVDPGQGDGRLSPPSP